MQLYLHYGAPSNKHIRISRLLFKPGWHFLKSATCPLRSRVFRLTEASFLRPDSPRTSKRNATVKLSNRQMIVTRYPMEWAAMNMMPDMMKPFMTQSLKISVNLYSFVRARLFYIDIMSFREFKVTALFFGCSPSGSTEGHPPRHLTVGQLL